MFPTLLNFVQQGSAWSCDTTTITGLALGVFQRFLAVNPANSGKIVQIYNFGGFVSAASTLTVRVNPTSQVNGGTPNITPLNQNLSSNKTSVLQIYQDTNATDLNGTRFRGYGLPANVPYEYSKEIIFLYPGQSIGISAPAALLNASGLLHMGWIEQALQ